MNYSHVYIVTNKPQGTLYVGNTTNLLQRIWQHKNGFVDSFTKRYNLTRLVYFEECADIERAALRERRLKHFRLLRLSGDKLTVHNVCKLMNCHQVINKLKPLIIGLSIYLQRNVFKRIFER